VLRLCLSPLLWLGMLLGWLRLSPLRLGMLLRLCLSPLLWLGHAAAAAPEPAAAGHAV